MQSLVRSRKLSRTQSGQSISQMGPALLIVLVFGFFPLVNFAGMGLSYAAACYYNDLELRELAVSNIRDCGTVNPTAPEKKSDEEEEDEESAATPQTTSDGGQVHKLVLADFAASSLAQFVFHRTPAAADVTSKVTFTAPKDFLSQATVSDETTFHDVPPFIRVPFFSAVPGLSSEYDIVVSQSRAREESR